MTAEIVSAFLSNDQVHLVAPGGTVAEKVRAEYSAFLRLADTPEALVRSIGRSSRVRATSLEGEWLRVLFRGDEERREVVDGVFYQKGIKAFEADVHPIRRLLADRVIRVASEHVRVAWLDIETDSRVPPRRAVEGEARLLSWCIVRPDGRARKRVLAADADSAEQELLGDLLETMKMFDTVAAWGTPAPKDDAFDFRVLDARSELHRGRWRPRRVLTIDYLKVFEKLNRMAAESGDEKASLKLGDIAEAVLKEGKLEEEKLVPNKKMGAQTYEMWAAGGRWRDLLVRYMHKDTDLMRRIEAEKGHLATFLGVCEAANCLPETRSLKTTVQMDGYLLREAAQNGLHWPSVGRAKMKEEQFKGAWVLKPNVRGIEKTVHVLDFKSMYPTIMLSWNMSPETIVSPEHDGPVARSPLTPARFRTDEVGFLAGALRKLISLRDVWKKKKKEAAPGTPDYNSANARTSGYKTITNGFYGGTGTPFSRYFNVSIAEAVTQTGVWLLRATIEEAERWGFRPLYGDTDGLYLQGNDVETATRFSKHCNENLYPRLLKECGCETNDIGLAYEKAFKRIIWPRSNDGKFASKRYAGKWLHYEGVAATEDSEPEVKGLESKRGDTSRLARRMQEELIKLLVKDECEDLAQFSEFISKWRQRALEGELERDDIVISNALKKGIDGYEKAPKKDGSPAAIPPHAAVAKILEARGEDVSEGVRIDYVVVSSNPIKAIPVDDWDGTTFDRRYLWNSRVWPASARLLRGAFPAEDWDRWLALVPKLRGGKPVPETQAALFGGEAAVPPMRSRRKADGVTIRLDHRAEVAFGKINALLRASPGAVPVTVEVLTPKGTAVLDMIGDRGRVAVDLTPALERSLRELGAEVFAA